MTNETLMTTWCRMWDTNPALAHDVMTPTCRQWSGQTPGLDAVTGPAEQEQFVTAYRAQHINLFQPRLLVDGGDRFAYLWDVTLPDGTVKTGADANILRDGLVELNWTFVSSDRDEQPDTDGDQATDAESLVAIGQKWLAEEPMAATMRREPFVDAERGRIAFLWAAASGTGLALLTVRDGEVSRVRSLTGSRAFSY